LLARIAEIGPDIVLMDLGNPSRDELEEYFTVSRALARPIAMFVDESDDESIANDLLFAIFQIRDDFGKYYACHVSCRRFVLFHKIQTDSGCAA
jgi:response regulator NasT